MEKISIEERVEGFRRFLEGRNTSGPLLGFFYDSYYPLHRYRGARNLPDGIYEPDALSVEDFAEDYERLYRRHEENGGDLLWTGSAFWGVPWLEAAAGCPVCADHGTGSSRSLPPSTVDNAFPAAAHGNPWVNKAGEFLRSLSRWSGGRYPLGTTLMRGLADLLSAAYGSPDFIFHLLDRPEAQHRLIERLANLWISFGGAQLEGIPDFHGGSGSFFYNCWLPGRGVGLQDDAVALLSPQLYREFIFPAQSRIIASFDSCLYHMHPAGYMPIDELCETALSVLELHIDVGGPGVRDLLPAYRKIQKRKPLLIWGELESEDVAFLLQKLDRRSLALNVVVSSEHEAEGLWRRFKR